METKKHALLNHSMIFGAILGLVLILENLLVYLLGDPTKQPLVLQFLNYVIVFGACFYSMIYYRDKIKGGYIPFGNAYAVGVLTGVFSGVFVGLYTFIFMKYIDPTLLEKILVIAQQNMLDSKPDITDEQLEAAMSMTRKMINPIMMLISGVFGMALQTAILSLIAAAIAKRNNNNPFIENNLNQ